MPFGNLTLSPSAFFEAAALLAIRATIEHPPIVRKRIAQLAIHGDLRIAISTKDRRIVICVIGRDGRREVVHAETIESEGDGVKLSLWSPQSPPAQEMKRAAEAVPLSG